jgi:hypothetical protein
MSVCENQCFGAPDLRCDGSQRIGYATNDRKPDRRDRRNPSRPAARFLAHSSSTLANQSLDCLHAGSNPEIFWSNFGAIQEGLETDKRNQSNDLD